jgi:hypothetical protein
VTLFEGNGFVHAGVHKKGRKKENEKKQKVMHIILVLKLPFLLPIFNFCFNKYYVWINCSVYLLYNVMLLEGPV